MNEEIKETDIEEVKKKRKPRTTKEPKSTKPLKTTKTVRVKKAQKKDIEDEDEITTNVCFNLVEVILIVLITGIVVSVTSGLIVFNNYSKLNAGKTYENTISNNDLKEFVENYNIILNDYVSDVNGSELLDSAIDGMYNYLQDAYSIYMNKDQTESLTDQLEGEYEGIGVQIGTYYTTTDQITLITKVFENTPAEKAGMKVGDIILEINNEDVSKKDANYISNRIKNGNETKFTLKVQRENENTTLEVIREHVFIKSVHGEVKEGVGIIRIDTFSQTTTSQVKEELSKFDDNVKSLIIDVRDNTGGLLQAAQDVSELFVGKDKVIYQVKDKDNKVALYKSKVDKYKEFDKITVLINEGTASASEILTLALIEDCNAKTVGQKSFGKGTIQETKELKSGAMVKYTIAYWLSPNGNLINEKGITPDYEIEGEEKQLNKALEISK